MASDEAFVCARCHRECDMRYEYDLVLGSGSYTIRWYRCPGCTGEYLHSPDLLTPGEILPPSSGVGTSLEVALAHSTSPMGPDESGGGSVGPLVTTALAEGMIDAALLPDFGPGPRARVITDPEDVGNLQRTWSSRARSFFANAALPANFDFLVDLESFARTDGGDHPRLAVVGRPCHVYAGRRANLANLAPGYEVVLAVGLFCYGNVTASGSPAMRFQQVTGVSPSEIRGITVEAGTVKIVGANRSFVEVPLGEFSSFLHKSCLRCVDFTVPWADLSLGESPQIPGFDTVIVRSPAGAELYRGALQSGRLRVWSPPWMTKDEGLRILADLTALKRELAAVSR